MDVSAYSFLNSSAGLWVHVSPVNKRGPCYLVEWFENTV